MRSGRQMMLVQGGQYDGWIVYRHPDGQWVTLRKATESDLSALNAKALSHDHRQDGVGDAARLAEQYDRRADVPTSIEQHVRDLLTKAIEDGLVTGGTSSNDPQLLTSGDLVGVANLLAEIVRSRDRRAAQYDDPTFDATDGAHPAWWRGCDHGTSTLIREANAILDGKEPAGTCNEPWKSLRKRLRRAAAAIAYAEARRKVESARDAFLGAGGDNERLAWSKAEDDARAAWRAYLAAAEDKT